MTTKKYCLVVSTNPSEKYEFVSWDDEIPNIWKVIKIHGSKPPTRIIRDVKNDHRDRRGI